MEQDNHSLKVMLLAEQGAEAEKVQRLFADLPSVTLIVQFQETPDVVMIGNPPDIALLMLNHSSDKTIHAHTWLQTQHPDIPVVVIAIPAETDISALFFQQGAEDYLFLNELEPVAFLRSLNAAVARHRASNALRKREQLHHMMFSACSIGVIVWDRQGRIEDWNPAAAKIFGWTYDEIKEKTSAYFLVPDDLRHYMDYLTMQLQEFKQPIKSMHDNVTKEGRLIVGNWHYIPVVDAEDNLEGFLSVVQDVTDRRNGENGSGDTEQMYQQILDAITEMVVCKGEHSEILWVNRAFRDYCGIDPDNQPDLSSLPLEIVQQYQKDDAYVFTTGMTLNIPEEPITRFDGRTRLFHTVKSPIYDSEGQVIMTVAVARDITELQEDTRALGAVREGTEQLGEELETVLHQLRDALARANVATEVIQKVGPIPHEKNVACLIEKTSHALEKSLKGIERITSIVSDLQKLAHTAAQKKPDFDFDWIE